MYTHMQSTQRVPGTGSGPGAALAVGVPEGKAAMSAPHRLLLGLSLGAGLLAAQAFRTRRIASAQEGSPAVARKRVELAVDMHCGSCVNHVRSVLEQVPHVASIDVDLDSQTAVVTGVGISESHLVSLLVAQGRKVRIIGLGGVPLASPVVPKEVGSDEEWSASVAEFKGPMYGHGNVLGVLRMVQLTTTTTSIEWELTGLAPESAVQVFLHKTGDTRNGAQSTGGRLSANGDLGSSVSDSAGKARYSSTRTNVLPVWETIGRAVVVSQGEEALAATVMARSANVGANSAKRLCTCSGTSIWESDSLKL